MLKRPSVIKTLPTPLLELFENFFHIMNSDYASSEKECMSWETESFLVPARSLPLNC